MSVSISIHNVTLSYARHPAVHHISGRFPAGSLTAIAGPNGAGKSTLLKAIAGIMRPDEGEIRIEGAKKQSIAYLPQAAELERGFPLSVLHLVCTGFWQRTGGFAAITQAMKDKALAALGDVGLSGFESNELGNLSSGQFQRVLFARLLIQDAWLILLDEPFAGIDADTTVHLIDIIQRWHAEKRTVLCVLHDFDQIRKYFPDCLLLARECIAWGPSAEALNPERLLRARFFREQWGNDTQICSQAAG